MSAGLSPAGQVLYILSALRHQGMLTVREKNLLKGMLLRRDDRVIAATAAQPGGGSSSGFEQTRDLLHELAVEEAEQRYHLVMEVFKGEADGFLNAAKEERASLLASPSGGDKTSLVYGEIEFRPFVDVLQQLQVPTGAKFVDLGSGCGKAVLAASLVVDFEELHGVEVLSALYDASDSVVSIFRQLEGDMHELPEDAVPITLHHEDFLDWDWSWADVVFANSTCFSTELVSEIAVRAARLKPGSLIITITQRLDHPAIELVGQSKQHMGWGDATFYIHRRRDGGDDSEGADARPHIAVTEPFEQPDGAAGVLRMISSPQSSALLEAKRRRRAAPMASDLGPRPAGDSFAAAGAERRAGSSRPATRVRPGLVSPTLRMEMDTGFRPSSPQGDALLARKMKRFHRSPLQGAEE